MQCKSCEHGANVKPVNVIVWRGFCTLVLLAHITTAPMSLLYFYFSGTNIMIDGLPPVMCCGARSSSVASSDHDPAQFTEKVFQRLEDDTTRSRPLESRIWNIHNDSGKLEWSSEASLCTHVNCVLIDVFREANFQLFLSFRQHMSLFQKYQPDLWVICSFGIPIGVVEVKKPFGSPLSNPKVIGQMYDYLSQLMHYTGRCHVFGILTTYNEWRIVWLPETNDAAMSATINTNGQQRAQGPQTLDVPDWDREVATSFGEETEYQLNEQRHVYGTSIISWNDPLLPRYLISVVRKMVASPTRPVNMTKLELERSYIRLNKERWIWDTVKNVTPVSFGVKVPACFQSAYLLADLGGGGDGRVWLASTPNGSACVLKFSNDNNRESLKEEARIWKTVWKCGVIVKVLNSRPVLVMPWLKSCTKEDYLTNPDIQSAVMEAFKKFAAAGFEHNDVSYRHIGLYRKDSKLKALLFDLARVSSIDCPEDAVTKMMENLILFRSN